MLSFRYHTPTIANLARKNPVNLYQYQAKRQHMAQEIPQTRALCLHCRQPKVNCYCAHIQRFDPNIEFVILIHPIEVRRRIATGRMSHLCLENSHLIEGENYSDNVRVNQLITDPLNQAVMLYPGPGSRNLSEMSVEQRSTLFLPDKKLVIFVVDGTWNTARNMVRHSYNIQALPRICFSLDTPSTFRVRKQPAEGCYSTIEAIHQVIELLGPLYGFATESRQHDGLLHVFDRMVARQLTFVPD
jgi:DTW domain-containing protein